MASSHPLPGRRLDPLGEVRKGMNGLGEVAHRGVRGHRRDDLVNRFARRLRGNMPAENLPATFIGNELDRPLDSDSTRAFPSVATSISRSVRPGLSRAPVPRSGRR